MKTRKHRPRAKTIVFEVPINGKSNEIRATPYTIATGDLMYRVSCNNSPVYLFGWDEGLARYAVTENVAGVMPPSLEMAIAARLHEYARALETAA